MARKEQKIANTKYHQFLCSEKPIISLKEARKILGKSNSKKLSDADLSKIIGLMHKLADCLIDESSVPKIDMVAWKNE